MIRFYCRRIRGMHLLADAGWEPTLIGVQLWNVFVGFVWWTRDEDKADKIAAEEEGNLCHVCGEISDAENLCDCEVEERRARLE